MVQLQKQLASEIDAAQKKRNKMVVIVVDRCSSEQLHRVVREMNIPVWNVSLLLSDMLRPLPPERRPFEVGKALKTIAQHNERTLFLNRIEYLFDRELNQNPLRLFESLSGNCTIVVQWPGAYENGMLTYGAPEHHEYFQSDHSYASYVVVL